MYLDQRVWLDKYCFVGFVSVLPTCLPKNIVVYIEECFFLLESECFEPLYTFRVVCVVSITFKITLLVNVLPAVVSNCILMSYSPP